MDKQIIDELSKILLTGHSIVSYEIIENKICKFDEPRKIIKLLITSPEDKNKTYIFNYKKLERIIRKRKKMEDWKYIR